VSAFVAVGQGRELEAAGPNVRSADVSRTDDERVAYSITQLAQSPPHLGQPPAAASVGVFDGDTAGPELGDDAVHFVP
jgi:hypothetical protein